MSALQEIFRQAEVIFDRAQRNYRCTKYLFRPDTRIEGEIIHNYEFLKMAREALTVSVVLDLCILMHQKGDYSVFNLINKLDSLNPPLIDKNKISGWRGQLTPHEETIKKLFVIRDKHYAHIDINRNSMAGLPTFEEFETLFKTIEQIFQEIHLRFFNGSMTYGAWFPDSLKTLLNLVIEKIEG